MLRGKILKVSGKNHRDSSPLRRKESKRWKEPPQKSLNPADIIIKDSSASDDQMNDFAKELLGKALDKSFIENEMATFMKTGFDKAYGPVWSCVVGRNFGSHLSCREHVHLSIAKISVIVFKCN